MPTTSVVAQRVATELGVTTPTALQKTQWDAWIAEAEYLIGRRHDLSTLQQADLDYVVLHAVADHARNPRNETQVDVTVQDSGSVSRRYASGTGKVTISDELWDHLDENPTPDGAFTVSPAYTPDWDARSGWLR